MKLRSRRGKRAGKDRERERETEREAAEPMMMMMMMMMIVVVVPNVLWLRKEKLSEPFILLCMPLYPGDLLIVGHLGVQSCSGPTMTVREAPHQLYCNDKPYGSMLMATGDPTFWVTVDPRFSRRG